MIYINKIELDSIIERSRPALIVFTSPQKMVPEESLLAFIHEKSIPLHNHIFVFNLIDQQVYEKYQILNFPQVFVLKGKQILMSFVGYNRQRSIEAIQLLSEELGNGRFGKKLNISKSYCKKKHGMTLTNEINEKKYVDGCFQCSQCRLMSHIQTDKPTYVCFECDQFYCYECSHVNVPI